MKIKAIILLILMLSCSPEQRIKDYSYTNLWYFKPDSTRYQVYQTKSGKKWIIILNKKQTRLKREYISE